MKNIGINEPCSENWNEMSPNEKGAFCQKCATQVYDFTNKTSLEIKQTLRELIGQPVCGRITGPQEAALNAEFELWNQKSKQRLQSALVFSLIVVFGLTLFSCSHEQDQRQIEQLQATAMKAIEQQQAGKADFKETQQSLHSMEQEAKIIEPKVNELLVYEEVFLQDVNLDEVEIEGYSYHGGGYGGAMRYSEPYREFLIQEVELAPVYDEQGRLIPTEFSTIVFPNPATTETTFELAVPVTNQFEINLFDMNGKFIQFVHSGEIQRGTFQQQINMMDLNPGIYLVTIVSKDYKETVRISKI
ncbi:MAG: T9SS type A sorting domain-containing protein [Flavobacteriia bacterium]|nr:T9SS type A sorting domain-containing protein [Flavobacteriia bacterium]